jgi:hypothetical protein
LNDISMEDLRNMKKVLISQGLLETVIFWWWVKNSRMLSVGQILL